MGPDPRKKYSAPFGRIIHAFTDKRAHKRDEPCTLDSSSRIVRYKTSANEIPFTQDYAEENNRRCNGESDIPLPLPSIATNSAANWFIVFVGDAIEWKQNVWCCLMENQTGRRVAPSNRSIICKPDDRRNFLFETLKFVLPPKRRTLTHSINTSLLFYHSYNPRYSIYTLFYHSYNLRYSIYIQSLCNLKKIPNKSKWDIYIYIQNPITLGIKRLKNRYILFQWKYPRHPPPSNIRLYISDPRKSETGEEKWRNTAKHRRIEETGGSSAAKYGARSKPRFDEASFRSSPGSSFLSSSCRLYL